MSETLLAAQPFLLIFEVTTPMFNETLGRNILATHLMALIPHDTLKKMARFGSVTVRRLFFW